MKIPTEVQEVYDSLLPEVSALHAEVDALLYEKAKQKHWFYRSRVKSVETFNQKLEINPKYHSDKYEDLLGCEIVVNTRDEIAIAIDFLNEHFEIKRQRPFDREETGSDPENFRFADLRLYVVKKNPIGLPVEPFRDIIFEIQLKTIFSYSWAKATHSIVYKTDQISWAKERVSFQVKAMLEQSEYAISNIEKTDDNFFPRHPRYTALAAIAKLFQERWTPDLLPDDLRRSADNILILAEMFRIDAQAAVNLLDAGLNLNFVTTHRSLSPFYASLVIFENIASPYVATTLYKGKRNKILIIDALSSYVNAKFITDLEGQGYAYSLS